MDKGLGAIRSLRCSKPRIRRVLQLVGWNALLFIAGLVLIASAGEAYFRLIRPWPFTSKERAFRFVPKVGLIRQPNAEVRHTNFLDFWTVSRTNSLGFVDREPPSPERAAESCHIAIIGDSFVDAMHVPIADKFQVRLERLAARAWPHLDVTTSAFGISGTGQINQLPFYDEFARPLRPKLVVLVFVPNDFQNNSAILHALASGLDPDRFPWMSAVRRADGTIKLRPPNPDWRKHRLPRPLQDQLVNRMRLVSRFANYLDAKRRAFFSRDAHPRAIAWAELLSQRPRYAPLLAGWTPTTRMPEAGPAFEEACEFTAFALDQFKERTDRDGSALVILAVHSRRGEDFLVDRLNSMAEARGIPVIEEYDYILRQGARVKDAHWPHDGHWNAAGHQWAAEALLDYLKQHPEICASPATGDRRLGPPAIPRPL